MKLSNKRLLHYRMKSESLGRYVVATKEIKTDEIIYTEIPFAFVPVHNYGVKKYFNTDCENCALVNVWPFLCLECRHSTYCSSQCRDEHFKIHKYECEGYKKNLFFEIGIAHLSLRVLLVGFPSLISKLELLADQQKFNKDPEKIFEQLIKFSSEFNHDYFAENSSSEFQEYARVLCLLPNLFRDNAFLMRNMPYVYVSIVYKFN